MIIKNAKVITLGNPNRFIEPGGVRIGKSGKIESVFSGDEISEPMEDEEIIDAHGQYLMPGGICAHTHFYGAFSRGMYIPGEAPDAFPAILEKLWWKLDKSLDKDANYYSAMVCLLDAIHNGKVPLLGTNTVSSIRVPSKLLTESSVNTEPDPFDIL